MINSYKACEQELDPILFDKGTSLFWKYKKKKQWEIGNINEIIYKSVYLYKSCSINFVLLNQDKFSFN